MKELRSVRAISAVMSKLFSTKYLLVTNVTSFGLLMGAADVTVQQLDRLQHRNDGKLFKHDWHRTGKHI